MTKPEIWRKSHVNQINGSRDIGESWGMANDGEWRPPHFQQKWKRGHK